jgi:hypothetical protein
MDDRVEIECRQIWIFHSDEQILDLVIFRNMNTTRPGIVQVGESYSILRTDLLPNDDFVDIIELVPIIVVGFSVAVQGFKTSTVM